MNLSKILEFLNRFVDFFLGFTSGYTLGSSKENALKAENRKLKIEKEIADAKAEIDLHYSTTPDADILHQIMGSDDTRKKDN